MRLKPVPFVRNLFGKGDRSKANSKGLDWGDLRRLEPFSRVFGLDRGIPIDRYYIQDFLKINRSLIRGSVLEVGDNLYTRKFGGKAVTKSSVLHVSDDNPESTLVGDLSTGEGLPSAAFDCVILTQTLQVIYEPAAALVSVHRMLREGGSVLATMAGISQISRYDAERWGDYWRFTNQSAKRLFCGRFEEGHVQMKTYGNVLTATAFMYGLAADELSENELQERDSDYDLLIGIRATKSKAA